MNFRAETSDRCYPECYPKAIFLKKKPVTHWITGKFNREVHVWETWGPNLEQMLRDRTANAAMQHWI